MFDLYTVIIPIFSVLALINLLVLKLAIKDNVTMVKIRQKRLEAYNRKVQNQDQSPTKSTIKYLLLHFTPLEICAVRRAKYKLCLLLSLSIIGICTYFVPSPYIFVATGTVVYFTYFFVSMALTRTDQTENEEAGLKKHRQKYLHVLISAINICLNFAMIGLVYKSYMNSMLTTFLANAGINIVIDNFLVRPTMTLVLSLPLSLNASVYQYVMECRKQVELLEMYETVGEKEMLLKPGRLSRSKIAKNIPLDMEIEPKPESNELLRNKGDNPHERPLDMLRKIKREKLLDPININLQRSAEFQGSLNSLFNSSKKEQESQVGPVEDHRFSQNFEERISHEEKICLEEREMPVKNRIASQNMIMVNPSLQEQIQNEEDIVTEQISTKKITEGNASHEDDYQLSQKRGATFNVGQGNNQPLRISMNDSQNPTSRQQPLRICLNGQINLDFQQDRSDDDEQMDNYRRRRDLMTLDDPSRNTTTNGVLEIKEKNFNHSEEIEEIDLNSPERRRRQGLHIEYEVESKMEILKKKKKKLSHDNHRVIKFSTGQPYLEYLPNMLSKDAKNKKSQGFSRKQMNALDNRAVNSVKRPAKKRVYGENNQNMVPEFKIEEI